MSISFNAKYFHIVKTGLKNFPNLLWSKQKSGKEGNFISSYLSVEYLNRIWSWSFWNKYLISGNGNDQNFQGVFSSNRGGGGILVFGLGGIYQASPIGGGGTTPLEMVQKIS